jgi:hypothetical protein
VTYSKFHTEDSETLGAPIETLGAAIENLVTIAPGMCVCCRDAVLCNLNGSDCGIGMIIETNCAVTQEFVVMCIYIFYGEVVK